MISETPDQINSSFVSIPVCCNNGTNLINTKCEALVLVIIKKEETKERERERKKRRKEKGRESGE